MERVWQDIMQEYLTFTPNSKLMEAKNSSHYIHLTEPELIYDSLKKLN